MQIGLAIDPHFKCGYKHLFNESSKYHEPNQWWGGGAVEHGSFTVVRSRFNNIVSHMYHRDGHFESPSLEWCRRNEASGTRPISQYVAAQGRSDRFLCQHNHAHRPFVQHEHDHRPNPHYGWWLSGILFNINLQHDVIVEQRGGHLVIVSTLGTSSVCVI